MESRRPTADPTDLPWWRRPDVQYTALGALVILMLLATVTYTVIRTAPNRVPRYSLTCLTHCQQLGTALTAYIDEHEGILPDADSWVEQLSPYVRNRGVFKCRSDESRQPSSYAMSRACTGVRFASIQRPGATIVLYEAAPDGRPVFRHHDSMNVVYADGHAATVNELPDDVWR